MTRTLTDAMRSDYSERFSSLVIANPTMARVTWARIASDRDVYALAGDTAGGVPWWVVGVLHMMETSGSFRLHLHNGDPLTARTVHVPAGRPLVGNPPFSWHDSAADALIVEGLGAWHDWSVAGTLYRLEMWNGWGYRRAGVGIPTPYLWAGCQHYTKGKFVADGKFDSEAVSKQIGAAVLLKRGAQLGDVSFAGGDG